MALKQLTALGVDRPAVKDKPYRLHVAPNLFVRVYATGGKSWQFRYTMPGETKDRAIALGEVANIPYIEAKVKTEQLMQKVKAGLDPAIPEKQEGLTNLQDVYDLFLKKGVDRAGKALRESTLQGYRCL